MIDKKYQIFVSSTYSDLVEAREKVIKTILGLINFPIGMEMFSADDDEQWTVIEETIKQSDYYIVIIGHRYGSEAKDGVSYTEKEYDYAKSLNIPVMAFIRERDVATTPHERDDDSNKIEKLNRFIDKAKGNKLCDFWSNPDELTTKVTVALFKAFQRHPRTGWVRADKAVTPQISAEIVNLSKENRELRLELEQLRAKLNAKQPVIEVIINDNKPIEENYIQEIGFTPLKYPQEIQMDDIPAHLKQFVGEKDVEEYNNSIPTKDEIDKYNREETLYKRAKRTGIDLSFIIVNTGSAKANQVIVELDFPDEVIVVEKQISEDSKPKMPKLPTNPITEAELKSQMGNSFMVMSKFAKENYALMHSLASPSPIISSYLRGLNTQNNPSMWSALKNNSLTIKITDLLHTRQREVKEDFLLVPLVKGEFDIKVSVICEEYEERRNYSIPIKFA